MEIIPIVGRMVYYKARGSADGVFPSVDRAAVVTDARQELGGYGYVVRLCVLNPEGMFFSGWLDQGQKGGQWDWMPFQKDQQKRVEAMAEAKLEEMKDTSCACAAPEVPETSAE